MQHSKFKIHQDQSCVGSAGIFSRRTNHAREAQVYSHDGPIMRGKRRYTLTTDQSDSSLAPEFAPARPPRARRRQGPSPPRWAGAECPKFSCLRRNRAAAPPRCTKHAAIKPLVSRNYDRIGEMCPRKAGNATSLQLRPAGRGSFDGRWTNHARTRRYIFTTDQSDSSGYPPWISTDLFDCV